MKGQFRILWMMLVLLVVFVVYEVHRPQLVDWRENYSMRLNTPMGTSILYRALPHLFPGGELTVSRQPIFFQLEGKREQPELYLFVARGFPVDILEIEKLLNYVQEGNYLFVAARSFPDTLLSLLHLKENTMLWGKDTLRWRLKHEADKIYAFTHSTWFTLAPAFRGEVLGQSLDGECVNYVRVPRGKGWIYLHTAPAVFSNHSLLASLLGDYYSKALSFLPPNAHVVWDEYQNAKTSWERDLRGPLEVILATPALKRAYYLLLLGALLYLLFRAKRQQRAIPVIVPPENKTLEFVSVVSSLYYKQRDHKNMACKRIACFLEEVRFVYHLRTEELDAAFAACLAERSGVNSEDVRELVDLMRMLQQAETVNERQLQRLEKQMELFEFNR